MLQLLCKNIVNLTLSWRRPLSYRNQSIDFLRKIIVWFLYDNSLRHEKVKRMRGYNCSFIIENGSFINGWLQLKLRINSILFKYLSDTLYLRNSWLQMLFSKKLYQLRNEWPQLFLWNKETLYPAKNCSLRLNAVTFKETFFRSNYSGSHPFLATCYFTRIFAHLLLQQYVTLAFINW